MDKYIKPDPRVKLLAETIAADLRKSIRNINRLKMIDDSTRITTDSIPPFNSDYWIRILSYMTVKISATHLGHTDYDFNNIDTKKLFLNTEENDNDNKNP